MVTNLQAKRKHACADQPCGKNHPTQSHHNAYRSPMFLRVIGAIVEARKRKMDICCKSQQARNWHRER
jgi:hypothetical protein